MNHTIKVLIWLFVLTFMTNIFAAIIPAKTKNIPSIDGKINDPAWENTFIVKVDKPVLKDKPPLGGFKTKLQFSQTPTALYISAECFFPTGHKPKGIKRPHDAPVFEDESFEVFMASLDGKNYYHFAVNAYGATTEREGLNSVWNCKWESQVSILEDSWIAEIKIPFASLEINPRDGKYWKINCCRNIYDSKGRFMQGLSLIYPGYHQPEDFLIFGDIDVKYLLPLVNSSLIEIQDIATYAPDKYHKLIATLKKYQGSLKETSQTLIPSVEAAIILASVYQIKKNSKKIKNEAILNYLFVAEKQKRKQQ
jgi:cellulose/xylan binding protein with CBM9 domain